jgi:hypothetical protein
MNVEGSQPAITMLGAIAWLAGPGLTAVHETNLQIKVLTTQVRIRYNINIISNLVVLKVCCLGFMSVC